jgi:acyl-CoA synthetase (AMP-forming)/AMP-acid ligase II
MASTLPRLPVFEAIARHDPDSTVVVHSNSGRTFKYGELLGDVCKTRNRFYEKAGKTELEGERIAFLVENSYDYVGKLISSYLLPLAPVCRGLTVGVVTLLAVLAARSIAVPLSPAFPALELQYILDHSEASMLLSSAKFSIQAKKVLATQLNERPEYLQLSKFPGGGSHEPVTLEDVNPGEAGMMLYTSGTTNRPVSSHAPSFIHPHINSSFRKASSFRSPS